MSIYPPKLYTPSFQDLVDVAKAKINDTCGEWTDHNLSDPGITLIELFAGMMEMLLYQLNQVPEKNYRAYLNLLGVKLDAPVPSEVDVAFTLKTALDRSVKESREEITIRRETQVATVRTTHDPAVTFATDYDLKIRAPERLYLLIQTANGKLKRVRNFGTSADDKPATDEPFDLFPQAKSSKDKPAMDSDEMFYFYIGFSPDSLLERNTIRITLVPDLPSDENPSLQWEILTGENWNDHTSWSGIDDNSGSNKWSYVLYLYPPPQKKFQKKIKEIDSKRLEPAVWIRGGCKKPSTATPKIKDVKVVSIGGEVRATNATIVKNEMLGRSNGRSGQVFCIAQPPMLYLDGEEEYLEVEKVAGGNEWERWCMKKDFRESKHDSPDYVCDPVAGEIHFGPALPEYTGGEICRYGKEPPRGARIRISRYRSVVNNPIAVGPGKVKVMKSSNPDVESVTNRAAASSARSPETIQHAMLHAPGRMRTRDRAVTGDDFERLAKDAPVNVGRVKYIPPVNVRTESETVPDITSPLPGTVRLLLVPQVQSERPTREELCTSASYTKTKKAVGDYLAERKLLCTKLEIEPPEYVWARVEVGVMGQTKYTDDEVKEDVRKALYGFLHPITGFFNKQGWPLGRELYRSDIYSILEKRPTVRQVTRVKLWSWNPDNDNNGDFPSSFKAHQLIASEYSNKKEERHNIVVEQ